MEKQQNWSTELYQGLEVHVTALRKEDPPSYGITRCAYASPGWMLRLKVNWRQSQVMMRITKRQMKRWLQVSRVVTYWSTASAKTVKRSCWNLLVPEPCREPSLKEWRKKGIMQHL